MTSEKEKRSKAEALLSQFKEETSKIEGLDSAIQQYLDQRFDRIEEMLEKILKGWIEGNKIFPKQSLKKHERNFLRGCFTSTHPKA